MPKQPSATREHVVYHNDGSLWARGTKRGRVLTGYWEWFRKDGSKLRSGTFQNGQPIGEWTTYDRKGRVYKVTEIKPARTKRPATPSKKTAKKRTA